MSQLYDRAEIYDLIENEKRTESIRRDWKQFLGEREIHSLLDVSIGTGGMTLPLQELGIVIFGSDLSEAMLSRCSVKAIAKNKPIELKCSDFRDLSCWKDRLFDCVASTGNALAYVSNEDVLMTLERMDAHVRPGGYLCFDSRNWEKIVQKEIFEEHYYPFPLKIVEEKLSDLGYDKLYFRSVPCDIPETDFEKIDWYRVIARKSAI